MTEGKPVRVAVNGDDVVHDGLVRAYLPDEKFKAVRIGDTVSAFDVHDNYDVRAVIEGMDGNVAFLRMDWDSRRDWAVGESWD